MSTRAQTSLVLALFTLGLCVISVGYARYSAFKTADQRYKVFSDKLISEVISEHDSPPSTGVVDQAKYDEAVNQRLKRIRSFHPSGNIYSGRDGFIYATVIGISFIAIGGFVFFDLYRRRAT